MSYPSSFWDSATPLCLWRRCAAESARSGLVRPLQVLDNRKRLLVVLRRRDLVVGRRQRRRDFAVRGHDKGRPQRDVERVPSLAFADIEAPILDGRPNDSDDSALQDDRQGAATAERT